MREWTSIRMGKSGPRTAWAWRRGFDIQAVDGVKVRVSLL